MNILEAAIGFNLSALAVLALSGGFYHPSSAIPMKKYSIVYAMIWVVSISAICSLLVTLLGRNFPWLPVAAGQLYFLARLVLLTLALLYTASLTDYSLSSRKRLFPWLLAVLALLPTVFLPRQFLCLDADGRWVCGRLVLFYHLLVLILFMGMGLFLLRGWKAISRQEQVFACVLLYTLAVSPAIAIPRVENFAAAICILLWLVAVPDPGQLTDDTTGMMNFEGFSALVTPAFLQKKEFPIGFLMVDNFYELKNTYGYAYLRPQILALADFLKTHKGVVLARIDRGLFCFVPAAFQPNEDWKTLLGDLEEDTLASRMHHRSVGAQPQVKVGVVSCPREADCLEGLSDLYDLASRQAFPKGKLVLRLKEDDLFQLLHRRQVELLLRTAVEEGRLHMVYQPIYDVRTGCFCGAEALMRMHSQELGDISPAEFIPIARETGSILQLSNFALDTVCQTMRSRDWEALGLHWMTVNLSAADLAQEEFLPRLLETLHRTGIDSKRLGIELSEDAFNAMPTGQVNTLEALVQAGICILLDDFGTDGGSLNYLCAAPVDIVKLDTSLTGVMKLDSTLLHNANTPQGQLALENAICMVQRLGKQVLAEGVETKQQADWLIAHGVDFLQGFYYAHPMDARSLEGFLKNQ